MKHNDLATIATCRACGSRLRSGPLAGLCPVCLIDSTMNVAGSALETEASANPAAAAKCYPWRFGRYEVLAEISRGGAGVVLRARDEALQRDVALKFLRAGQLASGDDTRRLFLEARAAARLNHPNIVPVFEVGGADDPQPFLAMAFMPGGTLSDRLKKGAVAPTQAAQWMLNIARAVQHAHRLGILHRDLKPGNILFGASGEPMVGDFGLARLLDEDHTLTRTDTILGTPAYLAPEQVSGRSGEISTLSDIHALGAILYEMLSGRPPFAAESMPALLRQIGEDSPVPPRQIRSGVPRDLETICLKCLEKEPARRYQTAQELAKELDRFLKDEPIHARPISRTERTWRWCRRKPALAGSLAVMAILFLTVLVGAPLAIHRIKKSRDHALLEQARAKRNLYAADMLLAQQALEENNLGYAARFIERNQAAEPGVGMRSEEGARKGGMGDELRTEASPGAEQVLSEPTEFSSPDPRGWEWRYLAARLPGDQTQLTKLGGIIRQIRHSPDGAWVAATEAFNGRLTVLDGTNLEPVATWTGLEGFGSRLAFHPSGQSLAVANATNLHLFTPATLKPVRPVLPFPQWIQDLAYSPDGKLLAMLHLNELAILDAESMEVISSHGIEDSWALAFSPDGRRLAIATRSKAVLVLDVEEGRRERRLVHAGEDHYWTFIHGEVTFSPDGRFLAVAFWDRRGVGLWETSSWKLLPALTTLPALCGELEFSSDSRELYISRADQIIERFDTSDWRSTGQWRGHRDEVWSLAMKPDGGAFLSSSKDQTVRAWETRRAGGNIPTELPSDAWSSRLSADGRVALVLQNSNRFTVLDSKTRTRLAGGTLPTDGYDKDMRPKLTPVAVSSNARWLALGTWSGTALLWDMHEERVAWQQDLPGEPVSGVDFSGDDSVLIILRKGRVQLFETGSHPLRKELSFDEYATWLAANPAANQLALVNYGTEPIRYWNLSRSTNEVLLRTAGHRPQHAALSPDGMKLATAGNDATVYVWELASGRVLHALPGQLNSFQTVCWSSDGSRLASGGTDGFVMVWDAESGQQVLRLRSPVRPGIQFPVHDLRFLDDERTLVGINSSMLWTWEALPSRSSLQRPPTLNNPKL